MEKPEKNLFIRSYVNHPSDPPFWEDSLPQLALASENEYFANREGGWGFVSVYGLRPSLDALLVQEGNDLKDIEEIPAYLAHLNELSREEPLTDWKVGYYDKNGNFIFISLFKDLQRYLLPLSFVFCGEITVEF